MKRLSLALSVMALILSATASESCERCLKQPFSWDRQKECATPATALQKKQMQLQSEEGVRIERKGDKFEIYPRSGKNTEPLVTVSADEDGLTLARKRIAGIVIERVEKLEKKFRVEISRDGEKVVKQWDEEENEEETKFVQRDWIENRRPKLDEVLGLEAALYRAQPSNWETSPPHGRGICIVFLTKPYYVGETGVLARYVDDYRKDRCALLFNPDGSSRMKVICERDHKFDPSQALGHSYSSIESLILHELSHHHQLRIGWWKGREKQIAPKLGWKEITVGKDSHWYIKGRRKDKPALTAWYALGGFEVVQWFAHDDEGKLIDSAPALGTRAEMRKLATVRPMTYYFPSPSEMYAEGVMIYRLGGQYRRSLLKESPAMYEVVKREDQREINLTFGCMRVWLSRNSWYEEPLYIRSPEGFLVRNTPANAGKVYSFEQGKE